MNARNVHLVGIGGIGLSAIARVLLARGVRVTGSDAVVTPITRELERLGARIYKGHRASNIDPKVELVVVTSAVGINNPEVEAARAFGIPVVKRRDFLGELTGGHKTIAIAGSHGKTTTTAMVGLMLADGGLDPEVVVGGIVPEFGSNARAGKGEYFVIEADEYDSAFLGLTPYIALVTNVDYDHPDLFPTRADYRHAFVEFLRRLQKSGTVLVCGDDEGALAVAAANKMPSVTYGLNESCDWHPVNTSRNSNGGFDFQVMRSGIVIGQVSTIISGRHNIANALGAIAAVNAVGVGLESARQTLERFEGVGRRFEAHAEWRGVAIVDDYAHHPTEIRATLAAARERFGGRELWVVFQPHTFSRTRALLDGFAQAFDSADHVIIMPIYAAREHDSLGVSGSDIVERMAHPDARYLSTQEQVVAFLAGHLVPGDVLITLGAGDVNLLVSRLHKT